MKNKFFNWWLFATLIFFCLVLGQAMAATAPAAAGLETMIATPVNDHSGTHLTMVAAETITPTYDITQHRITLNEEKGQIYAKTEQIIDLAEGGGPLKFPQEVALPSGFPATKHAASPTKNRDPTPDDIAGNNAHLSATISMNGINVAGQHL